MKRSLIFILILSLIFLSGCKQSISTSEDGNNAPESLISETGSKSELINRLMRNRNTSVTEKRSIKNILEGLPYFPEKNVTIEVEDTKLKITYNIGLRTRYRNRRELARNLDQIALTMYAVLSDVSVLSIYVKDAYGPYSDVTYTREDIYKIAETNTLKGIGYFNEEIIKNATKDKQLLESYVVKVLDLEYEKDVNEEYYNEIYKKLTDEEMIFEERTQVFSFLYNNTSIPAGIDLEYFASNNKIDLKKYYNKNLTVFVSDVVNVVKGTVTKKIFVFDPRSVLIISDNI